MQEGAAIPDVRLSYSQYWCPRHTHVPHSHWTPGDACGMDCRPHSCEELLNKSSITVAAPCTFIPELGSTGHLMNREVVAESCVPHDTLVLKHLTEEGS